MPDYRRAFVPGGCWFFTVNLLNRRSQLLSDNIDLLRSSVRIVQKNFPFHIDAMVVLPDHIHAVWTLPPDDADFSVRWRRIKAIFSKQIPPTEWRSDVRKSRGERGVWQRRFWEHLIRDDDDYQNHVDYCYFNPVKHGLVEEVSDWPHSTYHRDVREGRIAADWVCKTEEQSGEFGERP